MEMPRCDLLYLEGGWRLPAKPAAAIPIISPVTEQAIGSVARGSGLDVDIAVAAARGAFASFAATSPSERIDLLKRILTLLEERFEYLAQAICHEMGSAIAFVRSSQVPFGLAHIRAAIEVLENYSFIKEQGTTAIAREAIGVCALITPWNWPLYQITAKIAPALAAGCTIVLKPSELSPFSAHLFAQIMHDAGTPPGVSNMVTGTGEDVGAALASHSDIDMISITGCPTSGSTRPPTANRRIPAAGHPFVCPPMPVAAQVAKDWRSTRAGVLVAQAAAPTVKRVTQELGGKSPNILLDDADWGRVVPLGVAAAFRNVGQSCSAPTRMLVPVKRLLEVEELAASAAATMTVGDPLNEATVLGPLANRNQFDKVQDMIRIGIAEGAKLVCGGPGRPEDLSKGYFVEPTVFSEVRSEMRIAQEEIFGPVLCLIPYQDEDEAIRIANGTVYGLGSHVQSGDIERARRVAAKIRAGQVHINHPAWDGFAAFGGYKQSGNGREYGVFGLEEYLETKAILGFFPG